MTDYSPPPATWTATPPTVPGWYWYNDQVLESKIVEVSENGAGEMCIVNQEDGWLFPLWKGKYLGPLAVPEPPE